MLSHFVLDKDLVYMRIILRGGDKMKKMVLILIFSMLFSSFISISTSAAAYDEEIMPWYNNVTNIVVTLTIGSNGNATLKVSYVGSRNVTTHARITSKIQQNLSGTWVDININQPNNEWIDESTSSVFTKNHSVQLTSHGTYRAVVVYEISGTGGATDVIERIIEKTY